MHRLRCAVQNYEWGKPGSSSAVARLAAVDGAAVDEARPYAELWLGTHPSGPSRLAESSELLSAFIERNAELCGASSGDLPFLLKVLSVAKALSVQAHPDKALAERLHAARPDQYKDDNHKPEMAIALTEFEAMCGFRPLEEIKEHVRTTPELRAMLSDVADAFLSTAAPSAADLRSLFAHYMRCGPDQLREQTAALEARLRGAAAAAAGGSGLRDVDAYALRLCEQFPGDVGVFAPYLLNCVRLRPGEVLYLGANEPHAYLAGDIVECMACSDNVVRAGLTPKFKDVDALVDMLTYRTGSPEQPAIERPDQYTTLYRPPVPEFVVERVLLPAGVRHTLPAFHTSSSIALVVRGEATMRSGDEAQSGGAGAAWFLPARAPHALELEAAAGQELEVYRVHVNDRPAAAER